MTVTSVYKIQTHEQLKAIADPLRTKILMNLVKQEYTGQQLAEMLGITRNNIYFHLKELEKHQVIQIVRKEEKNGIVQKYYRAVASRFIPEDKAHERAALCTFIHHPPFLYTGRSVSCTLSYFTPSAEVFCFRANPSYTPCVSISLFLYFSISLLLNHSISYPKWNDCPTS